jgi:Ca2+-binding RTX toxin-like protein
MAIVTGTNKADRLSGGGGADIVKGFGGDDILTGGDGADWLEGGGGNDTADYGDSSARVSVDLRTGVGDGGSAEGDTLIGIENVQGSMHRDILHGNDDANLLSGMGGDDELRGHDGPDVLDGGNGRDFLLGGGGGDTLNGGDDNDAASYFTSSAGVIVSLITDAAGGGDAEGDDLNSIEDIEGSLFSDILIGDDGRNIFYGRSGADTLKGYGGNDALFADYGDDSLSGMDGDDYLSGGPGRDALDGGRNYDVMDGGPGGDTFVWSSIEDTSVVVPTSDLVGDFDFAEGDLLDLRGIDADVYAAGDQGFTFIGTAAFSGTPGEINYYYYEDGWTIIQLQTGTSTDVEGLIILAGIHVPNESWIML